MMSVIQTVIIAATAAAAAAGFVLNLL